MDLSSSSFQRISLESEENNAHNSLSDQIEYGMSATCLIDGVEASFRCVLRDAELQKLYAAIRQYIPSASINEEITNLARTNSINQAERKKNYFAPRSVMRTAITHAMDKHATTISHEQIRRKRGAFKWLPIFHSNDLVHGSWWFVVGSVFIVITAVVTLFNSFHEILGEDDSTLTRFHYRGSWVLMIISGIFFTLGSLAFVRAVHESPPMRPMFSWYHIGTDELLGSWLFLAAVIPFVPYALIYLSEAENNLIYIGLLVAAIMLIGGCFLFVLSCYPTPEGRPQRQYIFPILKVMLYCCCSKQWIYRNLSNDWLAGTWIILWGTFLTCFATLIMTLAAAASSQSLQVFIYGTTFLENLIFLVGSAYFVAGSYPDELTTSLLSSATDGGDFQGVNPRSGQGTKGMRLGGGSGGSEDVYYLAEDSDDV